MLRLLKRDLRLHALLLVTPVLLTTALAWSFGRAEAGDRVALAGVAAFVAGLLPLSFHLRESSEGTLGDLAALPVGRVRIVQLRYLEALLLPAAAVLLLCLEGLAWQALQTRAAPTLAGLPTAFLEHPLGLAWVYFWCCAYPLPAVLRWGAKGLGAVVAVPMLLLSSLPFLVACQKNADLALRILGAVAARWHGLTAHRGLEGLLAAALILLSFLLSLKAFAARDL